MNLETQTGHGALNSTHMVAFREESPLTMLEVTDIELSRSKRRSLQVCESEPVDLIVNANKESPSHVFYQYRRVMIILQL